MRIVLLVLLGMATTISLAGDSGRPSLELTANDKDLNQFKWLVGSWITQGEGPVADEHWTHPVGGMMLGVHRMVKEGRTVFYEYLRIETRPDGVFYAASPNGRCPPTLFRLKESAGRKAVFENLEHDFPQRITYWREGDVELRARIEGVEGGRPKSSDWIWRRGHWATE